MKKIAEVFFLKKVKASAMYFVILVAIIVGLILSSFLLLTHTFVSYHSKSTEIFEDIDHIENGIDSVLTKTENTPMGANPHFFSTKEYWGSFELLVFNSENEFSKAVLLGGEINDLSSNIYLADNKLPLVVAGNAKLEGIGYFPKNLIKPGSIDGNYFNKGKLFYGESFASKNDLPQVSTSWRNYIENIVRSTPDKLGELMELSNASNSFFHTTGVIYSPDALLISHRLQGNIIVKSEKTIRVSSLSELNQIILIAPEVVIESGFRGNIHIISNEIEIKSNSLLEYPSSVIVTENQSQEFRKPRIQVLKNSTIKGNIIAFERVKKNKLKNDIIIAANVNIEGSIYCEGYLDLRGRVHGNVFSQFFATHQNGSIYINHLYDGEILKHIEDLGGVLLEDNNKIRAKWLY
ncbi:hypothetical protein APR41_18115 [Salegentibacter salinarum]|uniref:Uncharacterized protein n=1 Tax=Salegentibacter salinarum TaxID=447422 RepID=A0A2N0TTG4_9FLAO|nr:hypothetical protein [Salegentibacter salinarum]PKD18029.1 hypothetical protein APR41_18115 [Salegentibacter salinarum]SKB99467.1 hypothetical protein SAMN05660903_03703 [Salegentibacter salinarum]